MAQHHKIVKKKVLKKNPNWWRINHQSGLD
jgi:hypothetical protein